MPQDFKQLQIWKESFDFGIEVYQSVIPNLPKEELYGLSSQLRRACVSISSNVSEGCGKKTSRDFASYIYNALGSAKECENLLLFSKTLGYISEDKHEELNNKLDILCRKLMNFIKVVEAKRE